jgi:predicted O-methyltransferase YrrM
MASREARRATFDSVAELYDRYRPSYSEQLIDDIVSLGAVPPRGRVLEIGSGTGKATLPFARRGLRITCVERGSNLARLAERHLAAFPNARVEVTSFEDWAGGDGEYDLVFAAQSFHFLDASMALPKIARLLRPGGALAVFGNHAVRGASDVDARIREAYARHAPELANSDTDTPLEDRIDATRLFGTVIMTRYRWHGTYTADDYIGLMNTQSPHRLLPDERREPLLADIRQAIESSGGSLTVEYVARLHLARRLERS